MNGMQDDSEPSSTAFTPLRANALFPPPQSLAGIFSRSRSGTLTSTTAPESRSRLTIGPSPRDLSRRDLSPWKDHRAAR